ncbi:hypothetical protein BDV59DRAFT_173549 [Aspergillus ambiguus]|uniref:copper homeostasis protein CutC n=1 Tax=Aspergillus ambiguus TaxID=176160 RepID=UPI003CCE35D3
MSASKVSKRPLLEIACFNPKSAVIAAAVGADRIELCKDNSSGGLTPESSTLASLKSQTNIPVYVMIRPNSHSFCYDTADFERMKRDISTLKALGADGFVFGILHDTSENSGDPSWSLIDVARNTELVQRAEGRPCTFHRAFDLIPETQWDAALSDIRDCGFTSILTSGGPSGTSALECIDKLVTLVGWMNRQGELDMRNCCRAPDIIVGGGVRSSNIGLLRDHIQAGVFHSAALVGGGTLVSADEVRKMSASLKI